MEKVGLKRAAGPVEPHSISKRSHLNSSISWSLEELDGLRTYQEEAWNVVAEKLNSRFGTGRTAEECRNQMSTMEKCEHMNCRNLATSKYLKCGHAVCHLCYKLTCGVCHDYSRLPDVILESVFLKLDPWQLALKVRYVCKSWHSVIGKASLWKSLCAQRGIATTPGLGVIEYRTRCLKQRRNLIKNGWPLKPGGRFEAFEVEKCYPKADGCKPLPKDALEEVKQELGVDTKIVRCWTWDKEDYHWVKITRSEEVDLLRCGLTKEQLDSETRPGISVSVWTAAVVNTESYYILHAKLLNETRQTLSEQRKNARGAFDGSWEKVSLLFRKVPKGTRYVQMIHSGENIEVDRDYYEDGSGNCDSDYEYDPESMCGPKFTGKRIELALDSYSVL